MAKDFFKEQLSFESKSVTAKTHVIVRGQVRFSVLSDRLLRVEVDKNAHFTDEPTQCVWFRDFSRPEFKIVQDEWNIKIITSETCFEYDLKSQKMVSITLKNGKCVTDWHKGNLKGTYRTLDMSRGEVELEEGLVSTEGVTVFDDAKSHILTEKFDIKERKSTEKDEYYFAYGHDYRGCINALYALCGEVPLVPRYCLGNWWSRYKAYSQQEYMDLMQKFIDRKIPITVATVDMDWHWVDLKRFGDDGKFQFKEFPPANIGNLVQSDGWTGYSWNTELFPDYPGFLKWLKDRNFKITLNIHPSQGVRPFEDMYSEFAEKIGINPTTKQHIPFDITNKKFVEAYFDVLHKPYEEQGVDFWWIDWQQGKNTKIKNLDPLWALNHYHYLYSQRENKRPLILSRYAQIGSHRYPLGFSGDTAVNWGCFDFQPYFTANAANVGYTWWSHDIGGHCFGSKDDELYIRWVQFGLYSPIMRLHSTQNEFMGKEPWKFKNEVTNLAENCLRTRHKMLPYIYSMNYRNHKDGIAICEPLYYQYPDDKKAYEYKNEYFFGSELIVAPITEKCNTKTNMAKVKVWLPSGRYTDIYNGRVYEGGREYTLYRGLESIPVLAKEGAIIPMSSRSDTNDWTNPADMQVAVYAGSNNFDMYEDDGETNEYKNGKYAITRFKVLASGSSLKFTVNAPTGDASVVPEKRNIELLFKDVKKCDKIIVTRGEKRLELTSKTSDFVSVDIFKIKRDETIEVELVNYVRKGNADKKELLIETISKFQGNNNLKMAIYTSFVKDQSKRHIPFIEPFKGPIEEILSLK